ncbi:ATP-binding cassette domain-containing protein [Flagellatimonas centrodinii]|uniref:ABC-F family ATP-binding cassette domain-containing protein n=1 Tax=Flagellatimonas centrodinii TaxID=2806210 RepID=UPI001FEE0C9E|nr:ATP-binding cassette domain-containing protein [Flagellatimonas centrodinii]ULQ47812.1 ATP-binding cassette domain-containing protein [Flagellatimonas centrodinii]
MLALQNLTLRRHTRTLIEGATCTIYAGQRVGVIGKNGVGKSSLFAAIRGELLPELGRIDLSKNVILANVSQDTPALDQPALDYALDGDTELRQIEARLRDLEQRIEQHATEADVNALVEAHDRLTTIDGYGARARAAQLLHGLGFVPDQQENPVASFSGGWRMRLNLARALLRRSDLLLLDEPTNHLDMDAALWLQETLAVHSGTLILISHDREFLDAVCTHTLHLERERATLYAGNYSQFERQRAERLTQQAQMHSKQQEKVAHLQSFIQRFKTHASKARQAQSRIKALERMEMVAPVLAESEFEFRFRRPEKVPSPLVHISDGKVGYGDTALLSGLRLSLQPGERVALLGANGAGKSTLMKSLAGQQPFLGGDIIRSPDLRVGYYAQHQLEQLDPTASAYMHLRRLDMRASEQSLRDYLGRFSFPGERQMEPIAPFSGGEKARLALAMVAYQRPNLLLLDEPTNHLDLEMRQALEMALNDYPGAVLLVSHDRHLVQNVCDTLWRVSAGECTVFDGDLDDYATWLRETRRKAQRNFRNG